MKIKTLAAIQLVSETLEASISMIAFDFCFLLYIVNLMTTVK